jgi:ribosomal protein S18 acetylase RimI-like enzyme
MQIRTINISDYDSLTEFWKTIPGVRLVDADSREAIDRYLLRNPEMSFIAEDDGKVVGSVFTGHDGRRGYLFHFAVAPEYRDLSLAKELLKRSFEVLKAEGITRCYGFILAGNDRAHKLAELTGWDRVTEFDVYSQWLVPQDDLK